TRRSSDLADRATASAASLPDDLHDRLWPAATGSPYLRRSDRGGDRSRWPDHIPVGEPGLGYCFRSDLRHRPDVDCDTRHVGTACETERILPTVTQASVISGQTGNRGLIRAHK